MNQEIECTLSGVLKAAKIKEVSGYMALSKASCYTILAEFKTQDISALLGQSTTLSLKINGNSYYYSGIISEARINTLGVFNIKIESAFALLRFSQHSRIFQAQTIPEIVKTILADYQLPLQQKLSADYPKLDSCVQYEESDFNFISRLLEEAGIFYFFDNSATAETLILADQKTAYVKGIDPADFASGEQISQLYDLNLNMEICPEKFSLNSYNCMQSSQELKVILGSHVKRIKTVQGSSNYSELRPGASLNLSKQAASLAGTKEWVIVSLEFNLNFSHTVLYKNYFQAIDAQTAYQPPLITPKPKAPNVQLATIIGASGSEYNTDQYGRLQVQFPWNIDSLSKQNSSWLWALSSCEGVLRVGTPVLVSFIDGDINNPIILGSLHQEGRIS